MTESHRARETDRSASEWLAWLRDGPADRALRVCPADDNPLGPRYYVLIDETLVHHPGVAEGRVLGIVGPASRGKLEFDVAQYRIEEARIGDIPVEP